MNNNRRWDSRGILGVNRTINIPHIESKLGLPDPAQSPKVDLSSKCQTDISRIDGATGFDEALEGPIGVSVDHEGGVVKDHGDRDGLDSFGFDCV